MTRMPGPLNIANPTDTAIAIAEITVLALKAVYRATMAINGTDQRATPKRS